MTTPEQLYGPLSDAIIRLFIKYEPDIYAALADFVQRNLNTRLSYITSNANGLHDVAAALTNNAIKDGYTPLLLVQLHQHDPGDEALRALVTELGIDVRDYPAVQATGLDGLQALAADPLTRSMLQPYFVDLEQLCVMATRIGGWKFLHDTIDYTRTTVLTPLLLVIKGPIQPSHYGEVTKLINALTKNTNLITDRIGEMKLKDSATPWLIKRLLPAKNSLQAALKPWPGEAEMGAAASNLGMLTSSDLSMLNDNIKIIAASIEALSMPEKLKDLQAEIAKGIADKKAAKLITDEIQSMDQQVQHVIALVDRHDPWQKLKDAFDNYLTVKNAVAARESWAAVFIRVDAIMDTPADLNDACTKMVAALATDDFDFTMQDAIGVLNASITTHFYAVDGDLLKAAEVLGQTGVSLGKVLEQFHG